MGVEGSPLSGGEEFGPFGDNLGYLIKAYFLAFFLAQHDAKDHIL